MPWPSEELPSSSSNPPQLQPKYQSQQNVSSHEVCCQAVSGVTSKSESESITGNTSVSGNSAFASCPSCSYRCTLPLTWHRKATAHPPSNYFALRMSHQIRMDGKWGRNARQLEQFPRIANNQKSDFPMNSTSRSWRSILQAGPGMGHGSRGKQSNENSDMTWRFDLRRSVRDSERLPADIPLLPWNKELLGIRRPNQSS